MRCTHGVLRPRPRMYGEFDSLIVRSDRLKGAGEEINKEKWEQQPKKSKERGKGKVKRLGDWTGISLQNLGRI